MSNLRELSRRIDSIESTRQITRTMEMVSTARVGEALQRASDAAPYKDAIKRMLSAVASSDPRAADQPLLQNHKTEEGVLFILIASDRGLAGGFNITLQRSVERRLRELRAKGKRAEVITCGTKPTDYFRYRGIAPALSFTGISAEPTHDEAMQVASYVIDGYTAGTFDRVEICYNHARNRVQQDVVDEQLLPVADEDRQIDMTMPAAPRTKTSVERVEAKEYTEFRFILAGQGAWLPDARLHPDGHLPRAARFRGCRAWRSPSCHEGGNGQCKRGHHHAEPLVQPHPPGLHHHGAQ